LLGCFTSPPDIVEAEDFDTPPPPIAFALLAPPIDTALAVEDEGAADPAVMEETEAPDDTAMRASVAAFIA